MGTNNYTDYSATPVAQTPSARMDQYFNGLVTDLVPRNSSGVPTANGGKCGTTTYPWSEGNFTAININGTPFDPNNQLTDLNQINSGATRSGSEQPLFLQADGSTNEATILATTTDLQLTIAGDAITFDTDVTVASLTTAPSSNNTCDIDNTNFSDQEFTKYVKEIAYDAAGSEITSLDGEFAAFKKDTEYFIAKVDNTNSVLKVYQRGFFFDSSNNPISRVTLADNDTITLMQLAWIYADNSGSSASVGYTTPTYSASQPSGAATNDYWFDVTNEQWNRYDGASWQIVNRILIGFAVIDTANCVATRCIDFSKNYLSDNTFRIEKATNSTTQTINDFENRISVYANNFYYNGRLTWDMTTDLESGVVEAADTTYYFYITNEGGVKISDEAPVFRKTLKGSYHPFHTWRWVGTADNDSSSDLENVYGYEGYTTFYESTSTFIIPEYVRTFKATIIGSGSSGIGSNPDTNTLNDYLATLVSATGGSNGANGTGVSGDYNYRGHNRDVANSGETNNNGAYIFPFLGLGNKLNGASYGAGVGNGGAGGAATKVITNNNSFYTATIDSTSVGVAGACVIEYLEIYN